RLDLDADLRVLGSVRDLDPPREVREPASDLGQHVPGDELHGRVGHVQLVLPRGGQLDPRDLSRGFSHLSSPFRVVGSSSHAYPEPGRIPQYSVVTWE